MLWALIRLSVRDAGSQLRYRRPPRRRSGLTRSDGAGTGSRARPEPGCDLTPFQDSQWAYTQRKCQETWVREAGRPGAWPRAVRMVTSGSEVHVAAAAGGGGSPVLLRLLRDHGLRGEEQARDRRRVLQRRAGDLRGVDDPGLEHVDVRSEEHTS